MLETTFAALHHHIITSSRIWNVGVETQRGWPPGQEEAGGHNRL